MTLQDRIDAFKTAFPKNAAAWPWLVEEKGQQVLYARWLGGQNYRAKSTFYGAYPPGYLERVHALFPDVPAFDAQRGKLTTLHVFSGSLPEGEYVRCDLVQPAEIPFSVYDLRSDRDGCYQLVLADPPYSTADAVKYSTPMIDRRRVTAALADVTEVGGHLVWLDTCWPMHNKRQWRTVGRIAYTRSTNHRTRDITIFERVEA